MDALTKRLACMSVDDTAGRMALDSLLYPKPVMACEYASTGPAMPYVSACMQNVLAEYWGFLMKSTGTRPGWMRERLKAVSVGMNEQYVTNIVHGKDKGGDVLKMDDLAWNLVVVDQRLCILKPKREESGDIGSLFIAKGESLDALDRPDHHEDRDEPRLFVIGYVRTYFVDVLAAMNVLKSPATIPPVLKCIANPLQRQPFQYNTAAVIDSSNIGCNKVQETILRSMSTNIEGIQGPPGTGKSTTIFHILNSMLEDAAVVTCVQNKAVDSIAEKLAMSTVPFVVLGNEKNLGPSAVRFTIEQQVNRDAIFVRANERLEITKRVLSRLYTRFQQKEKSRFGPAHLAFRRKLWGIIDSKREQGYDKNDFIRNSPWRRWWRAFIAERSGLVDAGRVWEQKVLAEQMNVAQAKSHARTGIMQRSKAVLCTIDTASSLLHEDNTLATPVTVAILDEAGTIPEYKMPLLANLGVSAIIAIGDQKQLEPFSHVDDHRKTPSGYFHRLAWVLPKMPMLMVQYRMHPQLCRLVSGAFYNGKLVTDTGIAAKRTKTAGADGVFWVDYADKAAETAGVKRNTSKWNPTEVGIIETFMARAGVTDLLDAGKTVMVISFYKEQTKAIQRMAEGYGWDPKNQDFRIVTVDAAQGSEADVVILSCVRSNSRGDIGFVENRNRMCVAISRAKEKLVIVGDARTFGRRPPWRHVVAAARRLSVIA